MAMRTQTFSGEPAIYEYSKARADEIYQWCNQTFGPPGPSQRWERSAGWFYIFDTNDYNWCLLRWQ
jgi:hypothetical protein